MNMTRALTQYTSLPSRLQLDCLAMAWLIAMQRMLTQGEIPNSDTIIASIPALDGKVFALLLGQLKKNLGLNLVVLLVGRTLR